MFAGGSESVRGFPLDKLPPLDADGNPLGGSSRIEGGGELRFPIYRLIHGVIFLDFGSLSHGFDHWKIDDIRWSTGGGFRLNTPVGPIRLEAGYQLQNNPPLDRYDIHFSLGFPF